MGAPAGGDPDPGSFHRSIRFLPRVQKTNPRRKPGARRPAPPAPGPSLRVLPARKCELFEVVLDGFVDSRYGHPPLADCLYPEAVANLQLRSLVWVARDRQLMIGGEPRSSMCARAAVPA